MSVHPIRSLEVVAAPADLGSPGSGSLSPRSYSFAAPRSPALRGPVGFPGTGRRGPAWSDRTAVFRLPAAGWIPGLGHFFCPDGIRSL